MQNGTDNHPDNHPDNSPVNKPLTGPDTFRYPDRFRGARWARGGEEDDESTWETYQDEGRFPSWV